MFIKTEAKRENVNSFKNKTNPENRKSLIICECILSSTKRAEFSQASAFKECVRLQFRIITEMF